MGKKRKVTVESTRMPVREEAVMAKNREGTETGSGRSGDACVKRG